MRRLKKQEYYQQTRQYRVRYDDLDLNHHMTNSHYFSWMEDMLERKFLNTHEPEMVDIKFDKEVLYGQEVTSSLIINEQTSYHLISQGDQVA
ncbi:thioesterase, partial [Lactobacillus mulieris]